MSVDDIVRAGRVIGMRRLSLKAVAAELEVSSTALYRHIDGRWELERLVGESLPADAHQALPTVPAADYVRLVLTASIRGLVDAAPPGRSVEEIVADLASTGGEV